MRLSASKLALAAECLWSFRPDVELPEQSTSVAAELGTALHAVAEGHDFAAVAAAGGFDADDLVALVAEWRAWWSVYSAGRRWEAEASYAFDTATGRARRLASDRHRDYSSASPTEICATLDAVTIDGIPTVLDLKTGFGAKTLAAYRKQVEFGALCIARVHNLERVRVAIAHVTAAGVFVDETTEATDLDAFDLDAIAEDVRNLVIQVPGSVPRPGPHCSPLFCAARPVCPATLAALAEAPIPKPLATTGEVQSDEDAERLLVGIPLLEAWCKERQAAVRRRALATGGVRMSDGHVYLATIDTRETIRLDVPGALEVLRAVLGEHTELALTVKTSKAGIERAARAATGGQRGALGRMKATAIEALREAGAIKTTQFDSYEYRPALPATGTEHGR